MREKNAAKMKSRFDTVNTQVVKVGDYVLVDARIKKKWRAKAILGERIYSMPGIVSEVNANGNILVRYKNGLETPINKPVPNNQFKVIDEKMYKSVEMSPIEDDGEDRSDEVPSNEVGQLHQAVEMSPIEDEVFSQAFFLPFSPLSLISFLTLRSNALISQAPIPVCNSQKYFLFLHLSTFSFLFPFLTLQDMDVQNDYMEVPVGWKPIPGLRVFFLFFPNFPFL